MIDNVSDLLADEAARASPQMDAPYTCYGCQCNCGCEVFCNCTCICEPMEVDGYELGYDQSANYQSDDGGFRMTDSSNRYYALYA